MGILGDFFSGLKNAFTGDGVKSASTAYEGGSTNLRYSNWFPTSNSVNANISNNAQTIKNRATDLVRNNSWARRGVDTIDSYVVGSGIKPLLNDNVSARDRENILRAWNDWIEYSDVSETNDFYSIQSVILRDMVTSGESLVRFRNTKTRSNSIVPLQLQVIDSNFLPYSKTEFYKNGNKIISGIELNKSGVRQAYHMYKELPGELLSIDNSIIRVPADQICHIFKTDSAGQLRGISWLASCISKLKELDQFEDAELVKAKVAAMFLGFTSLPQNIDSLGKPVNVDDDSMSVSDLIPGTMQVLPRGASISFTDPPKISTQYRDFMDYNLLSVSSSLQIPFHELTGNLRGANYSSIRSDIISFSRRIKRWRRIINYQLNNKVFEKFLDLAVFTGAVSIPGYLKKRENILNCRWIAPAIQLLDPNKEIEAYVESIKVGLDSREQIVTSRGDDFNSLNAEIERDRERFPWIYTDGSSSNFVDDSKKIEDEEVEEDE